MIFYKKVYFNFYCFFQKGGPLWKKIKKIQLHPRKKVFFEKLFFCIKITYFLVLGPYNYFLGVFWPKKLIFRRFHLDMHVSRSLLWLPYKRDFAPNRFKWSGIANWKMSENFVGLSLTVWQIWPEKWQKRGVLSRLEKSQRLSEQFSWISVCIFHHTHIYF